VFLSIETYLAGEISIQKCFDRDSNFKIFLLPELEAQKVEKTWSKECICFGLCHPHFTFEVRRQKNIQFFAYVIYF